MDSNRKGLAFIPTFSCNQPPVADAGDDQTVEWSATDAGATTLDGSGSSDPEGDPVTYSWSEGGVEIATGVNPTVNLALGEHTLTLAVTQADGGCDFDEVVITVVDTTPPEVTTSFEPVPGQRLTRNSGAFTVVFSCSDACDENPLASATLNGIAVTNGQVVDLRLRSEGFMRREARRGRSAKSERSAHSNKSGKSNKSARSGKSGKSGKSERPEEPMVIDGSSFSLLVTCIDESGNVGVGETEPTFAEKREKSRKGGRR
jgi:hypothetical protein